jgi:exopolysaccharide production protein ExoY
VSNTAIKSSRARPIGVRPSAVDVGQTGAAPPVGGAQDNLRSHLMHGAARLLGLLFVDLSAIGTAWGALQLARAEAFGSRMEILASGFLPNEAISGPQLAVAIVVSFFFMGSYRDGFRWRDPVRILTATGVGTAIAFYADLWHNQPAVVAGRALLVWLTLGILLVIARSLAGVASSRWAGAGMKHRVLVVMGSGDQIGSLDLGPGYRLVSSLRHEALPTDITAMERILEGGIDTIVVRGQVPSPRFHALTDLALTHGCRLLCAPYSSQLPGVDKKHVSVAGHPLIELTTPALRASHLVLKRGLDLGVASLAVVLLSPILGAIAVGIMLDSRGPVFFRQTRPGIRGRPFEILKFRSMRFDAEELLGQDAHLYERFLGNGCKLPDGEDPRITKLGQFLRKTSLDELPQLFNVIRGDMSLVGPRPLVGPELENYGERAATLLSVKPGMTGLWQVSGRSSVPFPERAEIDLDYVRNWSFLGDIWILMLTPAAVLNRRGAH